MEIGQAARIGLDGDERHVETGLPVLDHLVELLAWAGGFDLSLELAPDEPEAEVHEAGRALGRAIVPLLDADDARGFGAGTMPADEALATNPHNPEALLVKGRLLKESEHLRR